MSGKKEKPKPVIKRILAKESEDPNKPGFVVHVEFEDPQKNKLKKSPLYATQEETEQAGKTFQETGKFPKPQKLPPVKLVDRAGITGNQPTEPMGSRFPFGKNEPTSEATFAATSSVNTIAEQPDKGKTFSGKPPVMVFKNPGNGDSAFFYDGGTTKRYPKGYFLRSHQEIISAQPDIEKDGGSAYECPYWGLEKIRAHMEEQGYKLIKG